MDTNPVYKDWLGNLRRPRPNRGRSPQGGTISGASRAGSVVNKYLQHWQILHLFVPGASAIPQNPSGHPTLTSVALTYRTADAVVNRFMKKSDHLAD
jgi:gluconate 2-dehydrogenase alpha chain